MIEPNPPEPSMDEILASIRRIISEDAASATSLEEEDSDVLVLKDRAPEGSAGPAPAPAHAPSEAAPTDLDGHVPDVEASPPATQPEPETARDPVVASETTDLTVPPPPAAASFERLYFVVENAAPPSPVAVSAGGPTLEDLTKELLKPMVKAWLDENLDAIVRARVDEEVERISRGRVR